MSLVVVVVVVAVIAAAAVVVVVVVVVAVIAAAAVVVVVDSFAVVPLTTRNRPFLTATGELFPAALELELGYRIGVCSITMGCWSCCRSCA